MNIDYACFTSFTGYGFAARNYILALHKAFDIRILSIDNTVSKAIVRKQYDILKELNDKKERPDAITLLHCIPQMFRRIAAKGRQMAFATFEALTPPQNWIDSYNALEAIIVPSKFCEKAFASVDVPIHYVPHCLDYNIYNNFVLPRKKYDKFTFLFSGTWSERKNWQTLINSWDKTFATNNDVLLVIHTRDKKKAESSIFNLLKKKIDNIVFITDILTDDELPSFYKSFNCLVAPSLGEGFGYPGLQCLSVGVPIITTNYSGIQEYATENNAELLEPEGFITQKLMDGYFQFANQKWPYISINQLCDKMLWVYGNWDKAKEKTNSCDLAREFGYNITRERFERILK